jgi:hypothetical protein
MCGHGLGSALYGEEPTADHVKPEILQTLIESVAAALGDTGTEHIDLMFRSCDGEWFWTCHVEPKMKKHGRGRRVVRSGLDGYGPTPEAAVAEALRRFAIPGYVDL